MRDLIERQKAIDELISEPPEMNYGFYYAEKIKALPSAQPEPQWIPVSERLPEILTPVLVTVKVEDDYKVAHDWVYDNEKWAHYRDVVAWQQFPEPYREDGGKGEK